MKTPPRATTCVSCQKVPRVRKQAGICGKCRKSLGLAGIVGAGPYGSPLLRRGVHWLKFKGVTGVSDDLASLMLPKLLMIAPINTLQRQAILMPIPLHISRQRQRGFNQSEVLAESLSGLTKIPVNLDLVRVRKTWSQSRLPHDLRAKNMSGAFRFEGRLAPEVKWVLLVDDVSTSAATLAAAAKAWEGWDGQVWGVVAARR